MCSRILLIVLPTSRLPVGCGRNTSAKEPAEKRERTHAGDERAPSEIDDRSDPRRFRQQPHEGEAELTSS